VHEDISGAESIVKRVQARDLLVSSAKDRLKKHVSAKPEAAEFRTACLTTFQWFAAEGRWDDLKDAIPVYTLDSDETEMMSKTSTRGALLTPRELWPDAARPYWDAFPRGSVLADGYASLRIAVRGARRLPTAGDDKNFFTHIHAEKAMANVTVSPRRVGPVEGTIQLETTDELPCWRRPCQWRYPTTNRGSACNRFRPHIPATTDGG
jgi:hypothetical protein